ncbi:MAG: hypothetical protein AB7R89_09260 [Dehalococcoidia bacterium]
MDSWDWTPLLATNDDAPEAVHRRWYDAGLVDGLPIVSPTAARVRRFYRTAGLDPARHVAVVEPSQRAVSVYDIAVCAVAAGCEPAHLPIVVAAVTAVCAPAFNLLGIQTTTGTATPAIIVHGPIATAAGVSGERDCLGGSTLANAAIGRSLRLLLRSVGGGSHTGMDQATMGQPAKLGLCFAENLARSPWPPLHAGRGFLPASSAVTVAGISGSVEIVHADAVEARDLLTTLAGSMLIAGSAGSHGLLGGGAPLIVLAPEHARLLDEAGYDRADVQRALWQEAVLPWERLAPSVIERYQRTDAAALNTEPGLRIAATPDDVLIAVAGGIGVKSTYLPSWGGGTRAVTVPIE